MRVNAVVHQVPLQFIVVKFSTEIACINQSCGSSQIGEIWHLNLAYPCNKINYMSY